MTIRHANIRKPVTSPKREIEWDGCWYKIKSNKIEVPNLAAMTRIEALLWLNRETYARGYRRPNPLAGLAGALSVATC